jgi:hypothetical protein
MEALQRRAPAAAAAALRSHGLASTSGRAAVAAASCRLGASAARVASTTASSRPPRRRRAVAVRAAERREYYDYKDMPPLPLTVSRITVPELGYTVVDKASEAQRSASLAIFYDIWKDDQYGRRLTRKSAITALCMYDRDDVSDATREPGVFPNIDLLHRVYNEGLELELAVDELPLSAS